MRGLVVGVEGDKVDSRAHGVAREIEHSAYGFGEVRVALGS